MIRPSNVGPDDRHSHHIPADIRNRKPLIIANKIEAKLSAIRNLENYLDALCDGSLETEFNFDSVHLREALSAVALRLKRPMVIDAAEKIEAIFKRYLKTAFQAKMNSEDARFVAEVSKSVGFVLKFKPYGIKCATALGYSIFFLRPGMGFSFQRHRTRKTELFHMLEILERGQIYLSTSQEWDAIYDHDAFNLWLAGEPDARYQTYSRRPDPGDVYMVTELDTVHSVLGCVLEEFATVSTDMVDRLHDQNTNRDDCPIVAPETVNSWLSNLARPLPERCWASLSAPAVSLDTTHGEGIQRILLANTGAFVAERFEVAPSAALHIAPDANRARSIFCLGGKCRVMLQASDEVVGSVVSLASGEVILIGPNITLTVEGDTQTSLSSHTILPALALD